MIRYPLTAAVVLVAVLVAPAAATGGVNSADLILTVCPFLLVAVVGWPRRSRRATNTPVERSYRGRRGRVVPRPGHAPTEGIDQ